MHPHEEFPRLTTVELVGQAEARRFQRPPLIPWLVGAGLGAILLGLPSERLWGHLDVVPEEALAHAALGRLVRGLATLLGTSAERAWFLTSALALALCVPALVSLLNRMAVPGRRQLWVGACVLLSPIVVVCARLPTAYVPGLLGAILLVDCLMQRGLSRGLKALRATAFLLLAGLLHPQNYWLVSAIAVDVACTPKRADNAPLIPKGSWIVWSGAALFALLLSIPVPPSLIPSWAQAVGRVLLGGGGGGPGAMVVGAAITTLGLGVLLPCLVALFFSERAAEESPPPPWVYCAGAAALVPWIAGSPAVGPIAPWLPVLAALGGIDRAMRRDDEEGGLVRLASAQVALTLLLALAFDATDPDRNWRHRARQFLEADDIVLTMRADHAYLLKERWGLEPRLLPAWVGENDMPTFPEPSQRPARVVFDAEAHTFPRAVRARAEAWGALSLPAEGAR